MHGYQTDRRKRWGGAALPEDSYRPPRTFQLGSRCRSVSSSLWCQTTKRNRLSLFTRKISHQNGRKNLNLAMVVREVMALGNDLADETATWPV